MTLVTLTSPYALSAEDEVGQSVTLASQTSQTLLMCKVLVTGGCRYETAGHAWSGFINDNTFELEATSLVSGCRPASMKRAPVPQTLCVIMEGLATYAQNSSEDALWTVSLGYITDSSAV